MADSSDFQIDQDYWKAFPEHKIIFLDEYENDTPSYIMWAIRMMVHPNSEFANHDTDGKRKLIKSNYILRQDSVKDFNWGEHTELMKKYEDHCLKHEERMLNAWKRKLEEKGEVMANHTYTIENFEEQEKIMNGLPKQWDIFKKVREDYDKSKNDSGTTQGDVEESFIERGVK